jgi:hypothetical protein
MTLFLITDADLDTYDSLTEDDIGLWGLLDEDDENILMTGDKSDCLEEKRSLSGGVSQLSADGFLSGRNQLDSGDDIEDDQGGVWGENLDFSADGGSDWNAGEIVRDW